MVSQLICFRWLLCSINAITLQDPVSSYLPGLATALRLGWPLWPVMWMLREAHTFAATQLIKWAYANLLAGWLQTCIGPMLGQMGISRGKYVGPAWQLVVSPHVPHHWQPMWGPWECPSLAIHGAHRILLSGASCGTNMDINRGQNVGPTQKLTASPHESRQWQPMSARNWPFLGPMGFVIWEICKKDYI